MNPELKRAAELAAQYLDALDQQKVSQEPDPQAIRNRLQKELTDDGLPPLQVIEELAEDARDGLLNTANGRFFGWVIGGGVPVAIAADWAFPAVSENSIPPSVRMRVYPCRRYAFRCSGRAGRKEKRGRLSRAYLFAVNVF